ncbi:MAG: 2'-5' RNA ligase family protein [Elusimicrobia bacterium]|nr:2'-5' RNA ligase family protein [Elusimicrobiota bacterium]
MAVPKERLLAVDAALIPPLSICRLAGEINETLLAEEPDGFRFDQTHIPHITLLQQFIRASCLPDATRALDQSIGGFRAMALEIRRSERISTTAHLVVEPNADLRRLHESVVEALAPWAETAGGEEAFLTDGDERPRAADVQWVTHFREQSSSRHFQPHITLGVGAAPVLQEAVSFTADRMALCHLGRYCTCRGIFWEGRLRGF